VSGAWARLALAIALNAALAAAWLRDAPPAWLHPVAPPLTRIDAMGDLPLGAPGGGPPPMPPGELTRRLEQAARVGTTDAQRALLGRVGPAQGRLPPLAERGRRLRVQVEYDAIALAEAMGPDRVGAFIARRETLSASMGETRVWEALAQ
jgi:hypothetical protein